MGFETLQFYYCFLLSAAMFLLVWSLTGRAVLSIVLALVVGSAAVLGFHHSVAPWQANGAICTGVETVLISVLHCFGVVAGVAIAYLTATRMTGFD